jgi:predicted esterase
MIFFSGFGFSNERELFSSYFTDNKSTVVGFSYGAISAIEYLYSTKNRVENLILLSPIFFQNESNSFKKSQLNLYKKNSNIYMNQFYKNVLFPLSTDISKYKSKSDINQLEEILYYKYNEDRLTEIKNRKIEISILLGAKDKIINHNRCSKFFEKFGEVCSFNNYGHLLYQENK